MSLTEIDLHLENVELAQARSLASELKDYLVSEDPSLSVELRREDPTAQDLGSVLVLLAGTAAAKAIAEGIRAWLAKRRGARVKIKTPCGSIVITNATSQDLAALERSIAAFLKTPG